MSEETTALRIGYVPEHFSTPLFLAHIHQYYDGPVDFKAFPSGTGHMIQSLRSEEIDVAVGLTEGWIAGIKGSQQASFYKVVGQYVASPLCWAISTGAARETTVESLKEGAKIGVSRIGSGSYIMSFVLAQQNGWLSPGKEPFEFVVLDNFKNLRDAVNSGVADAFMWEHFTSKKFYDSGEIKRIGEIYTPWPSWLITARTSLVEARDHRLKMFLKGVNKGISHFKSNPDESIKWITDNLEYSEEDAKEWMKGVEFVDDVRAVDIGMVNNVILVLKDAAVVKPEVGADGVVVPGG